MSLAFVVVVITQRTLMNAKSSFILEQDFTYLELLVKNLSKDHTLL